MSDAALQSPTLFEQVLGDDFARTAGPVQALHRVRGVARYAGRVSVVHATHPLARVLARITRLPPAMHDAPLRVDFDADGAHETWRRSFDGHVMRSRLYVHRGALREWLGTVRFAFALRVDTDGAVSWRVSRVHVWGVLPLPPRWFDAVRCRESADGDRYTFEINAAMPVIGRVVRYEGWLQRE